MAKVECKKIHDACYTLYDINDEVIRRGCDFYRADEKTKCFFFGANNELNRCQCLEDFCNDLNAFSLIRIAKMTME